jgi:HSP20 family protein
VAWPLQTPRLADTPALTIQENPMSNLTVRREPSSTSLPAASYEPFRLMRDMMRWDPFREMAPTWFEGSSLAFAPAFDVRETKEGYVFKADLPGVAIKDLDVAMTGNRLTISGKRETDRTDSTDTWYSYERSYGSFTRSFTMPDGIDAEHLRCDLTAGVLTIVAPKTPAAQPKKIAIAEGTKKA